MRMKTSTLIAATLLAASTVVGAAQPNATTPDKSDAMAPETPSGATDKNASKMNPATPETVGKGAWTQNQPNGAAGDRASPPNGGISSGAHNGNEGPLQRGNTVPPEKQQ